MNSSQVCLTREGRDRCPGALAPFSAEDGLIVRARVPGGEVMVGQLEALMAIGREHGTPRVQLTTRSNLQVRGLPDPLPSDVAERIAQAGLLPSASHEKARNILAAPFNPELRAMAHELDQRLCERPVLADLPGRFLFLLSDATGVGLTEPYDVAYVDQGEGRGLLVSCGAQRACLRAEAIAAMLGVAEAFLAERTSERQWNIRDLPDPEELLDGFTAASLTPGDPPVPGVAGEDLVAGVPLGLIDEMQLAALSQVTAEVVVTPWRSVVVPGGAAHADQLAEAGLVVTAGSPWNRISACTGAPYCARAHSETMNLARECAQVLATHGPRIHLVGCQRTCGRPRTEHIAVVGAATVADVRAAVTSGA